jgi:hypothetical protein
MRRPAYQGPPWLAPVWYDRVTVAIRLRVAVFLVATGCSLALLMPQGWGQDDDVSPLIGAMDDPLALGRAVQRHGDAIVLNGLDEDGPTDARLAAVHASPWLRAPETALAALADLAAGRDPHLAPAALDAAHAIAEGLDLADLGRREAAVTILAAPQERFAELAGDGTARADMRRMAAFTADALAQLTTAAQQGSDP